MADIVERLRFDATRCELQFSKGVASNIEEAATEIERLRSCLRGIADPETALNYGEGFLAILASAALETPDPNG